MVMKRLALLLSFTLLVGLVLGAVPAGADEPKAGGTLTVIHNSPIPHLNNAIRSGTTTGYPATKIFASPLRFDLNYDYQPYLAESWEFSEDQKSLTLNLTDAVFHDGQPVTSEDVAFSIMTIKAKHPFKTMFAPVEKVDTPDEKTAIIRLSAPHPALLTALTPPLCPILPKHVYGGEENIRDNPANLDPVGSGPFKVSAFKPDEYLVLERFEDYFIEGRPYLDKLVFRVIPDAASRTLAMENQEADLYPELDNPANILRLQKKDFLTATPEGYSLIGPIGWLEFNTKKAPFDNQKVRQAIAYAIDRQAFLDNVFRGMAAAATGPIAPGTPFYTKDVGDYDVNIEKANQMLDEAGYPRDDDGIRFEMTIDAEVHPDLLQQYLLSQLKKVGIKVNARVSPDFPTWAERTSHGQHDATVNIVYNWGDPVIGVHRTYITSNIKPGVPYSNTSQYSNPEVDEILAEAAKEMDREKRKELYAEFQKIVVEDAPLIYMYVSPYHLVYNNTRVGDPVNTPWGFFQPGDLLYAKD
jgi:peptide/nickel transport system substrate-binding protein